MPRRVPKQQHSQPSRSGKTGGAATARGVNYQYDFAVLQALELIDELLGAPHREFEIQMEPRVGRGENVTRWDFAIRRPEECTELKLNPVRADIIDILKRAKQYRQRVRLVYSSGSGRALVLLDQLVRIAKEASGNATEFKRLVEVEAVKRRDEVLAILGDDAAAILSQFEVIPLPEDALHRQIGVLARHLAGEQNRERLHDKLFSRFAKASPERQTISISSVIADIQSSGIELIAPTQVEPADLSHGASTTVAVLQECVSALPREIIEQAVIFRESFESDLEPLIRGNVLSLENGVGLPRNLPTRFRSSDHSQSVARVLKALLTYIQSHTGEKAVRPQVQNAIQLAKVVLPTDPELTASVFPMVEKILKRAGNKHLVLEVAILALAAVKRSPPSRGVTEMKAVALICGVSWAYQRLGLLREARVAGERSMELGKSIGWERNTAFCLKCLGRLYRLEAEQALDAECPELFGKSEEYLRSAINIFAEMPDFGPQHPQLGDCYSLLAHTLLVQDKLEEADAAVKIADSLITDVAGKEHLDVVILKGDLAIAFNRRNAAEALYTEALEIAGDDDDERTEMRARAHLQRGRNRRKIGNTAGARNDFLAAARIWDHLNEPQLAAVAELENMPLRAVLGIDSLKVLSAEPAIVATTAFRLHQARSENLAPAVAARAKDPGPVYWKQLVQEARALVAITTPEP